jgi:hypothetical protein
LYNVTVTRSMLSSFLRSSKGPRKQRGERSPFSSPFSEHTSPLLGRRRNPVARKRVAANVDDSDDDPDDSDFVEEEAEDGEGDEEAEDGEDEDEDEDDEDAEDGIGQATPLLPIFEASHLGTWFYDACWVTPLTFVRRLPSCIQYHTHHQTPHRSSLRDYTLLGPVTKSSGQPVPRQTYTKRHRYLALLASDHLRAHGELSAVQ